jgi:hypothetical protein
MPTQARYYSSNAAKTTLAASISSSAVSLTLAAASNLPAQYPYTLILEKDTGNEEVVEVTGLVGSAYQINRNIDSSGAKAHAFGANVEHGVSARDFNESRQHEVATSGHHGVTGDIVGTGGTQTLTSKTLTSPAINGGTITTATHAGGTLSGAFTSTATITGGTITGATITGVSSAGMVDSSAAPKNYVDSILGSATAASTSAASAATSASSAATSASSAATSRSSALTSQTSAATSATSAATSASSALTSQTSAATSASSASVSASAASTSASSASTSASSAATSATSAAASATTAAASVATIATSASQAATSASSAATSATSAANSATTASASAATATTSAATAVSSAATAVSSAATAVSSAATAVSSAATATTSAAQAATSATSAAASATAAATSAASAATSATSAAASATAAAGYVVPSQTGNAGKFLGTNGTAVSWGNSATSFIPTGSTVPTNGLYLPSANTLSLATNSVSRIQIDSAGKVGISAATNAGISLVISTASTGQSSYNGVYVNTGIAADTTSQYRSFTSLPTTTATAFTLSTLRHFFANGVTVGAGSAVTTQVGYYAESNITGATTNYGFQSTLAASGTANWNFSANGTAPNFFQGRTGIGVTLTSGAMAQVTNTTAADVGFIVKGAASQTGDLLSIQNSAGTVLAEFDSSGNLGIGTTALTTASGYGSITLDGTNGSLWSAKVAGTETFRIQPTAATTTINGIANIPLLFNTNNTERMRIDNAGNVGIGGIAPATRLDVRGAINVYNPSDAAWDFNANDKLITLRAGNDFFGSEQGVEFATNASGPTASIWAKSWSGDYNSGRLTFLTKTAGSLTQKMTIDESGNTGIGTTTPTAKLDVNGSIKSDNQIYAGKNALINGAIDFAQRGTSITTVGGYQYTLDRFITRTSTAGGSVVTTQELTNDTTNLPNIQYCARLRRSTGNTNGSALQLSQAIENVNSIQFIGSKVTLSFYARKSANWTGGPLSAILISGTGTDQNLPQAFTSATIIAQLDNALTTTWTRYSVTTSANVASSVKQLGFYMGGSGTGTAPADDYFEVTGIQLEVGSVATTFSRNSGTIQGELAACQRYFQIISGYQAGGNAYTTTAAVVMRHFPVTMRVAPTPTYPATLTSAFQVFGTGNATPTAVTTGNVTNQALTFYGTGTGTMTQFTPVFWSGLDVLLSSEL